MSPFLINPHVFGDITVPTITSSSTASVAENATLSHALTASESVTWSLLSGADIARFEISGSTLRWLSNGVKDFEAPDDADTNNTYVVTVRATDAASNTSDQTITITVTDTAEDAWALVNNWTYSAPIANVDFIGLAGYTEVRVVLDGVSASAGFGRQLLTSTDNGSTFMTTTGDYIYVNSSGVEATLNNIYWTSSNSTSAQSAEIIISGWNLTTLKTAETRTRTDINHWIIPTTSALNALRIINQGGGNLSAGSIYVFAR